MQELIEYTLKDLETIAAAAPYSQYHQMMLAMKRNEMQRSTLYQPVLGTLPALEKQIHKALEEIEPIPRSSIEIQQNPKSIDQSVEIDNAQIETDLPEPSNELVPPPLKIEKEETEKTLKKKVGLEKKSHKSSLSKKTKSKKKKKKSQKSKKSTVKDKFSPELNDLSPFTQWLMSGENDSSNHEILSKKKKKKSKKKSKKKIKKSKSVVDSADKAQKENIEVVSEPLAFLLAEQGHTKKAIKAFTKLITLFPEKRSIYEEEIKKLKDT